MAIKSMQLQNFKRFRSQEMSFDSPVVVILGENSSGKSSLLKAMLGLKQTVSPSNEHECWAAHGDYVDLGTYQDYVHRKDIRKSIGFKVSLGKSGIQDIFSLSRVVGEISKLSISIVYDYDAVTTQARFLSIRADFEGGEKLHFWELRRQKTRKDYSLIVSDDLIAAFDTSYRFPAGEALAERPKMTFSHVEKFTFRPSTPRAKVAQLLFSRFVNETIGALASYLEKKMFYLGPLRSSPSRSYIRSSHNLAVGVRGEHTPSVLANLERRSQKVTRGKSDLVTNFNFFERGLAKVFPGHVAKTRIIEELVKLKISNKDTEGYAASDKSDTITDVGFGFSQVFPILVQTAVMPAGGTLVVEQPELHLHPMAQTRLAGFVADAAVMGKRFIIETHSEHFVRGLQLAISEGRGKKGAFSNKHVVFYYIRRGKENEPPLEINEYGEFLSEWPPGFFDESYRSVRALLKNKLKG